MEQEKLPLGMLFKDKEHTVIHASNFKSYLESLPDHAQAVILYILKFLATSNGSPTLLGYTWAQCLIRPVAQNIDTTLKVLMVSQVVTMMITNLDAITQAQGSKSSTSSDAASFETSDRKKRARTHIGMVTRSNSEMTLSPRKMKKLKDTAKPKEEGDRDRDAVVSPRSMSKAATASRSVMDMLSPRRRKKREEAALTQSAPSVAADTPLAPKPPRPTPVAMAQPAAAPPSRVAANGDALRRKSQERGGGGLAQRAASPGRQAQNAGMAQRAVSPGRQAPNAGMAQRAQSVGRASSSGGIARRSASATSSAASVRPLANPPPNYDIDEEF